MGGKRVKLNPPALPLLLIDKLHYCVIIIHIPRELVWSFSACLKNKRTGFDFSTRGLIFFRGKVTGCTVAPDKGGVLSSTLNIPIFNF